MKGTACCGDHRTVPTSARSGRTRGIFADRRCGNGPLAKGSPSRRRTLTQLGPNRRPFCRVALLQRPTRLGLDHRPVRRGRRHGPNRGFLIPSGRVNPALWCKRRPVLSHHGTAQHRLLCLDRCRLGNSGHNPGNGTRRRSLTSTPRSFQAHQGSRALGLRDGGRGRPAPCRRFRRNLDGCWRGALLSSAQRSSELGSSTATAARCANRCPLRDPRCHRGGFIQHPLLDGASGRACPLTGHAAHRPRRRCGGLDLG